MNEINLWSYQKNGFDLTSGTVDHSKSRYFAEHKGHFEKLWGILGTNQIVWCCNSADDWSSDDFEEWQLQVPETSTLTIVNSMVWNGILGLNGVSIKTHDRLSDEADQKGLQGNEYHSYIERELERLHHPPGDPWEALFLDDPAHEFAQVLLRHPIDEKWVLQRVQH